MKRKGLLITLGIIGLLVVVSVTGFMPEKPVYKPVMPALQLTSETAGQYVNDKEAGIPNIKPDNASKVIYSNDSLKQQTDYCLLYLHGFTASWKEGYPTNSKLAEEFGMNAYFPRLASHGLDTPDPLIDMTPDNLWESAKEALVIAQALGKKVVVMATSSGAILALRMAVLYPERIAGIIMLSPNVRINNPAAFILSKPFGLQLGRMISGGNYRIIEQDPALDLYWYKQYRVEGVIYLQQLVETSMKKELFKKVIQPVYTGYYFNDKEHQDNTVKVSSMLWMLENLGTPPEILVSQAFPDAGAHVIGSELTNPNWKEVFDSVEDFVVNKLKISKIY